MVTQRLSSGLSSLLSCPWKCAVSSLVRPRLTFRIWPRKRMLSWKRAPWDSAPQASLLCTNQSPHPPADCVSTTPSSVRKPGSANSRGARWPISPRLPPPPHPIRPRPRETGRPAAKNLRGRPMGEKHNGSVGPPLRPLLPCRLWSRRIRSPCLSLRQEAPTLLNAFDRRQRHTHQNVGKTQIVHSTQQRARLHPRVSLSRHHSPHSRCRLLCLQSVGH